jgi:BirA family biotin operon repressor/biotin-[acetyl-CoA-carboxylase] ligase
MSRDGRYAENCQEQFQRMSRDGRYSAKSQEGGAMNLLPLSIALAIVETLENLGLKQVQVKWPNDVYVQGKKIAGILIETQAIRRGQVSESVTDEKSTNGKPGNGKSGSDKPANDKQLAVVIGLGLNYQMLKSNHKSDQTRPDQMKTLVLTDICQQIQSQKIAVKPTRSSVASALLCNVITVCHNFSQVSAKNLEKFRDSYDFCKQKEVKIILDNNEVLTGVAQGVNGNAELLVLVAGELRVFNSADVSVRADMSRDGLYAENCQEQFQCMSRDGRTDFCSCKSCTSTIRGGRMSQRARKAVD